MIKHFCELCKRMAKIYDGKLLQIAESRNIDLAYIAGIRIMEV